MKYLFIALLFAMTAPWAAAHAASSCNTVNGNKAVAAGAMTPPLNAAYGNTVGSVSNNVILQCRNAASGTISYTNMTKLQPNGALVVGYNDVYQTNISGLGVRYIVTVPDCSVENLVITGSSGTEFNCAWTTGTTYLQRTMTVVTEFVTTGAFTTGSVLSSIPQLQLWYTESDVSGTWLQVPPLSGSASGTLSGVSCTISNKDLTKQLDDISVLDLNSVGATAAPMLFQLSLNCPTGNTKVAITLTDSSDATNRSDTLKLAGGSTARGVGIQLLKGDSTPILLGPDSADAGNANQWVAGTATGGGFLIPLQARYIRTGTLTGGTVKAIATYTMSYQ